MMQLKKQEESGSKCSPLY